MCIFTHDRNPTWSLRSLDWCLLREASWDGNAIPLKLGSHLAAGHSCIPGVSDCLFANSRVPHTISRSLLTASPPLPSTSYSCTTPPGELRSSHARFHAQLIPVRLRTGLWCLVCICSLLVYRREHLSPPRHPFSPSSSPTLGGNMCLFSRLILSC